VAPVKRGRGRPKKPRTLNIIARKRGRPSKNNGEINKKNSIDNARTAREIKDVNESNKSKGPKKITICTLEHDIKGIDIVRAARGAIKVVLKKTSKNL
jgi:hypothetical protein